MSKSISVIGATVQGNHGAEAMLAVTVGQLRDAFPDSRFNVFSYYPRADAALAKAPGLHFFSATPAHLVAVLFPFSLLLSMLRLVGLGSAERMFPASVRALAASRMLIDLAGVSFVDGREKFLPFNILTILPAMLLGVPVVKFAQAMGPFRNPVNRFAAKTFLTRCTQVFGRGERTMTHLRELDMPPSAFARAGDVAFLLKDDHSLTGPATAYAGKRLDELAALRGPTGRIVGICPSSVIFKSSGEDYVTQLARLVAELVTAGHAVLLFPNATRADQPDKLFNNDLPVIRMVLAKLPESVDRSRVVAIEEDVYAIDIKQLIAACDLVVVSRFHAMVGALALGVPPLVIGWSHKYAEVMQDFGIEANTFNLDSAGKLDLWPTVQDALLRLDEMRGRIAENSSAVFTLSRKQIDYVVAALH